MLECLTVFVADQEDGPQIMVSPLDLYLGKGFFIHAAIARVTCLCSAAMNLPEILLKTSIWPVISSPPD